MFQLPADCLNDIIEYLENDKRTLYSCILVNRLWCETNQKKILYDNKIISTPTTKFPTFNYASFCKVLFIYQVYYNIDRLLRKQQTISSHNLKNYLNIVVQEIFKLFIFNSSISTELFYQLTQICYNVQSFTLELEEIVSNGIVDLISVQRNLKYFEMILCHNLPINNLTNIIPLLTSKISNALINLDISGGILKIKEKYPRVELLIKFLEINGKNLKEIRIGDFFGDSDNSLNLAIAKFCPNLRILSTGIKDNELETLKMIFGSCKSLKSIKIWCGNDYLNEKEALEFVVKYSQNIHELIFYHLFVERIKLLPEELESFFISWTNRKPQKSISLVIGNDNSHSLAKNYENMEIIKKYIKLGFIKKFKVTNFDDVEYN
ncbi:hypothetical protein RclHR1_09330006 [Rhizophagus clarus]|uniref:F-box domain-containing protein n=1 Tax=Rhizophagus clarus TaxID=94130 RepID=A0A2Z6S6C9_9GLOM|nr:hypothetical protein RclHR1_09330006 [Rhizophagus clarus]